jgi:hypothetical protein
MIGSVSRTSRALVSAGLASLIAGLLSSTASAEVPRVSYCENDSCKFSSWCNDSAIPGTGCSVNAYPIGTCQTYNCEPE